MRLKLVGWRQLNDVFNSLYLLIFHVIYFYMNPHLHPQFVPFSQIAIATQLSQFCCNEGSFTHFQPLLNIRKCLWLKGS